VKYVLIAAAVLAVLVGIVYVIGLILPQNHTAVVSAKFDRPADVVWAAVIDIGAWHNWNKSLQRIEHLGDTNGHATWRLTDSGMSMTYEIVEATPPAGGAAGRMVTRILPGLAFGGTWTYEVAPAPGGAGTVVTITEAGEIYNPFFRFMARFFFGYTGTAAAWLRAFGGQWGAGVAPEVKRAM